MNCFICNKPLVGKYYIDEWEHCVCASHVEDGFVTSCSSCHGFTNTDNTLIDGRVLCNVCFASSIKKDSNVVPIVDTVTKHLRRVGFNDLKLNDIKIEVVSALDMAKIRKSEIDTNNKGITLSNIVSSFGLGSFGGKSMNHTIYMLSHQTKIEFAGTLAHEILHAWQAQNNITPPPKYCEGLCNLGTYMILNSMDGSLTKVLINNMLNNPDPIYGDGFREVLKIFEEEEWSGVIEFYRMGRYH